MKKTVLITGASSGIGKETALYFLANDWNVVATMRHPEKRETELHKMARMELVHLDVTDGKSIRKAISYVVKKYGKIDVLVNNAGYGLLGPFELTTKEQVDRQFQTNVFGLMDITREIIPVFRKQKEGVIVNVASMGGRTSFPMYSAYNASKWAVEGFSESIVYELAPFGIRVKVIEPGGVNTDFYGRSMDRIEKLGEYEELANRFERNMDKQVGGVHPKEVAKVIFQAANDKGGRLRYIVGNDAKMLSFLRKLLPEWLFLKGLGSILGKK